MKVCHKCRILDQGYQTREMIPGRLVESSFFMTKNRKINPIGLLLTQDGSILTYQFRFCQKSVIPIGFGWC
jgi:hypothetical protein